MITAFIALHECLGTLQAYSGVKTLAMGVIGMADEQVSILSRPDPPERLCPQAIGHLNLKGLRRVLNDLK